MPLYVALNGSKVTDIVVNHRKRIHGKTKYGFLRIYELILEMIRIYFFERHFSFPLYYFGLPAFILIIIGATLGILTTVRRIIFGGAWISPIFFISIILVSLGVQTLFMGILAEILVRISLNSEKGEIYVIKNFKG